MFKGFNSVIKIDNVQLGSGIYCIPSYINHSCTPNAYCRFDGDLLTIVALTEIDQKDEITISYGPLKSRQETEDRQSILRNTFRFTCTCDACLE
jgi:SET domain-containing protein